MKPCTIKKHKGNFLGRLEEDDILDIALQKAYCSTKICGWSMLWTNKMLG